MNVRQLTPSALMGVCEEGRSGSRALQIDPQARIEAVKLAIHWCKDRNADFADVIAFAKMIIACIESRD